MKCGPDVNASPGIDCAHFDVPIDYTKPDGPKFTLAMFRHPATGKKSQGPLIMNPGGPGVSTLDYINSAEGLFSSNLTKAFDIIGVDPRGVGLSTPVIDCTDDLNPLISSDPAPRSAADEPAFIEFTKSFAQKCLATTGKNVLAHVSTIEAAKDMDAIRAALGVDKLTYFGFSYGTFLGAEYANLFPDKVRAMVLDGAEDPSLEGPGASEAQASGFERAFNNWAAWCKATTSCAFHHEDPIPAFDKLIASITATPIKGADTRLVTWGTAINGVAASLYSQSSWETLAEALRSAEQGDGSGLESLADQLAERDAQGNYTNAIEALNAIDCLDVSYPSDAASFEKLEVDFRAKYPHIGYALAWGGYICAVWPVAATGVPDLLTAQGAPPIIVVATTGDPATPYESGVAMSKTLKSGVLLTNNGEGHTAYRGGSNTCIDNQIDDYLLSLKVPTKLTCN